MRELQFLEEVTELAILTSQKKIYRSSKRPYMSIARFQQSLYFVFNTTKPLYFLNIKSRSWSVAFGCIKWRVVYIRASCWAK